MTISAILSDKGSTVWTIAASSSVREAVALLSEHRIGAAPVVGDRDIVGVFSERDLVNCISANGPEALDWPVERAMSAPAITVESATPILSALSTMTQRRVRHLPVVESGEIRGIVSIGDLVKYRIERIEAEADALRTYIQSS